MSYLRTEFCKCVSAVLVILFLSSSIGGCNKSISTDSQDVYAYLSDTAYLPCYSGYWLEYQIDSTIYSKDVLDTEVTTVVIRSYIREVYGDPIDSFGLGTTRSLTYYYSRDRANYSLVKVHQWNVNQRQIILTENNLSFVKLNLPVVLGKTWQGNQYLPTHDPVYAFYRDWVYQYKSVNQPYAQWDSTITITKIDDQNAIEKRYSTEIIAKNVGTVYAKVENLKKQNTLNGWDKPENGVSVTKTLIDWKR